ncbi:hypothetical protein [Microbacterium sp. AR7-10]|uniref:hypothetical protein n=1 Tax=Microbacterium sp. AR7-10 TaxID=1891970 RepID=UPI0009116471|nr:hypothetical protein [Microbacterium sp. AR7-10]OIU87707.1 hypothetical protein BFN01_08205 [Microbacterium sp. AR7-10]
MPENVRLPLVADAARALAHGLANPSLLVTLHRDIDKLHGLSGRRLGSSKKQYALRWAIFSMSYAALEAFFNDILREPTDTRALPLNPDKLRNAGNKHGVRLFTNDWGVRTRALSLTATDGRSRWMIYEGTRELAAYLSDMKNLRDLLNHGQDPTKATNRSGALWPLASGGHSMRLMGAEGFIQACCDLASQTVMAYGGSASDLPEWPEPERSGLSAEKRPKLALLP